MNKLNKILYAETSIIIIHYKKSSVTIVFYVYLKIKVAPLRVEFCCKLCGFEVLVLEHLETASL